MGTDIKNVLRGNNANPEQPELQPLLEAFRQMVEGHIFDSVWPEIEKSVRQRVHESCKAACGELGDAIRSQYNMRNDEIVIAILVKEKEYWERVMEARSAI